MKTRKLLAEDPRIETGPTKFGDDWTGLFIRGDDALFFSYALEKVVACEEVDLRTRERMGPLLKLLRSVKPISEVPKSHKGEFSRGKLGDTL